MSGTIQTIFRSLLGGCNPGRQPPGGLIGGGAGSNGGSGMIGSSERGRDRFIIREALGNSRIILSQAAPLINTAAKTTPFRRAYNAGDIAGTYNDSPSSALPGSNQVNGRAVSMLNIKSGGAHNNGAALFSGNPKFVYDGTDYTRYKKLKAINKSYNDSSFGGANNGSYVALNRVRH
jgi:hypothetical protein